MISRAAGFSESSLRLAARRTALLVAGAIGILDLMSGSVLHAQSRDDLRQTDPAPARQPADMFDRFRSIGERNIVDSSRLPRMTRGTAPTAPAPTDRVVTFVGTLQYEKGLFAFFDGNDPRYQKTIPIGDSIAGFTVAQIAPRSVSLTSNERILTLRLGESLRRSKGGDWIVSTVLQPLGDSPPPPAAVSASPNTPVPIPSDAPATLRRLMEQRQKQLTE